MFVPMTEPAAHAVQAARDKATYNQESANSGHLLQTLFESNAVPATVFGVDFDYTLLRTEISQGLALCRWGRQDVGPEAPSFKRSLSLAVDDAVATKSLCVTPAHLLLAVAMEPTGPAGWVLAKYIRRDYVDIRRSMRGERYRLRSIAA